MFEEMSKENIQKSILDGVGASVETREGSFLASMVAPVSVELEKLYGALNALVPIAYVDESSGGYLDLRCGEYGITRKAGAKARAAMALNGTAGKVVPKGTAFLSADGLEFELLDAVALTGGQDMGTAEAAEVGEKYNVGAGELARMVMTIPGLERWTSAAATGGVDEETDAALAGRLYDFLQKPATSGNVYHYEQWAKEVPGVGDARVTPLHHGPGTVKVLLVGPEHGPVLPDVVGACAAHIEENRPIGATVTVHSAQGLAIHVSAQVTLDGSATLAEVRAAFAASLDALLKSLAFNAYTLLYNRVVFLLLDIPGVTDYEALTINGGTANVAIGGEQVPVLGEVVLS